MRSYFKKSSLIRSELNAYFTASCLNLIDQRENDERSSMGQLCGVTKDVINGQQLKEVLQFDYLDSQNQ